MNLKRSRFIVIVSVVYTVLFLFSWLDLSFICEVICPSFFVNLILSYPWTLLLSIFDVRVEFLSLNYYALILISGLLNFCILFWGIPLFQRWLHNPRGKV